MNIIIKVVSTEILIRKNTNNEKELILLQVVISDNTGMMNAIFKNDNIRFAKIGQEIIIRDAEINILNGNIFLICNENRCFECNNNFQVS